MITNVDDDRQPWERREGETPAQWLAFTLYLGMGPSRSISKAWLRYRQETGRRAEGLPHRWFNDWTSKNDWYARACAYDQHQAEEGLRRLEKARNEALDVIAAQAPELAKTLIVMGRGRRVPNAEVDDRVIASVNKDLLDRIGAKAPDRVELTGRDGGPVEVDRVDLSRLSDDEIKMLLALRRKAEGEEGGDG